MTELLTPPESDTDVARHKFYAEASTRINRLDDSTDKIWGYVRKHETFKDRLVTVGWLAFVFIGGIQVMSSLYLKDAINTQLEPVSAQVAKIELNSRIKEEADKQMAGIPDQVLALRQMVSKLRDDMDNMKGKR